jgi:hypothetical protein
MAIEEQPGWGDKGYDDPPLKVMSGNAPVETLFSPHLRA